MKKRTVIQALSLAAAATLFGACTLLVNPKKLDIPCVGDGDCPAGSICSEEKKCVAGAPDPGETGDAGTTDDSGLADAGTSDAGTASDAGTTGDAGSTDDAGTASDAGSPDDAGG